MADEAEARALLRGVQGALAHGVKHYDKAGKELTTPKAILECLLREGGVTLKEPGVV